MYLYLIIFFEKACTRLTTKTSDPFHVLVNRVQYGGLSGFLQGILVNCIVQILRNRHKTNTVNHLPSSVSWLIYSIEIISTLTIIKDIYNYYWYIYMYYSLYTYRWQPLSFQYTYLTHYNYIHSLDKIQYHLTSTFLPTKKSICKDTFWDNSVYWNKI